MYAPFAPYLPVGALLPFLWRHFEQLIIMFRKHIIFQIMKIINESIVWILPNCFGHKLDILAYK